MQCIDKLYGAEVRVSECGSGRDLVTYTLFLVTKQCLDTHISPRLQQSVTGLGETPEWLTEICATKAETLRYAVRSSRWQRALGGDRGAPTSLPSRDRS